MSDAINAAHSEPTNDRRPGWTSTLLAHHARQRGDLPAVSWLTGNSVTTLTWREYHHEVIQIASALLHLGVRPGDTVAILATNRVEHLIADLAASHCGAASTSLYFTLADPQLEHVLNDAAPRIVVVENVAMAHRIAALSLPAGRPRIVVIGPQGPDQLPPPYVGWAELRETGALALDVNQTVIDQLTSSAADGDPLVYVYTSGTTGPSKGVILTHRNIADEIEALIQTGSFDFDYSSVSYLPLAHIAERLWTLYVPLRLGGHVWCCPRADDLLAALRRHRPSFFLAVPRTWDKLRNVVAAAVTDAPNRHELETAQAVLSQHWLIRSNAGPIDAELAADVEAAQHTTHAVRHALGLDHTVLATSTSAPIAPALLQFFASVGITIYQGYGLTETAGVAFSQRPGRGGLTDVGTALPGCEARIAPDGEIMVRSTCNSPGYRNRPDDSARLYSDGWMRTGDIGRIDEHGRLFVTARKKDLIITAAGKNIAPAPIEDMLAGQSFIDHAIVVGDARPYLVALIFCNPQALTDYASTHVPHNSDLDTLIQHAQIRSHVQDLISAANARLSRPEQIKQFAIIADPLTVQSGALTPTLKLRRQFAEQTYSATIETLYAATQ